jgi:hypothetical protein
MNVLILTPDRVGSTLLQRLITVYMQAYEYDRPVINLHELTNGLIKYYSPVFNREVLGKPNEGKDHGYYQTLDEITELLHSTDHYKTARLAHYHIQGRADTIAEQVPFYKYLNDNFFIISAQRDNLLEHGLSWCINGVSKRLNVFSAQEKINVFSDLYRNKITVDPQALESHLYRYIAYQKWVLDHFQVGSYFKYDLDLSNIEQYILALPMFAGQAKKTWKDIFQLDFADWNRCHYLVSDLSGISGQLPNSTVDVPRLTTDLKINNMQLQSYNAAEIPSSLSVLDQQFLIENGKKYVAANKAIQELVDNKIMVTPVPIKLQTMLEKKLLINNFDQCVDVYNNWVERTGHGTAYSLPQLEVAISKEIEQWHVTGLLK